MASEPKTTTENATCGQRGKLWWMYQPDITLCSHDWNHFVRLFIMGTCNDN